MSGALVIREATDADLPGLVALLADDALSAGREDASLPLDRRYLAAFDAVSSDPNQLLFAAERDGRLVGTMQISFLRGLSFRGALRGQIESVRVASSLRGQGIGRQMILWAVENCRQRGCRLVQLMSKETRTDAHRFYLGLGFEQSHAGFKLHFEPQEEAA